MFIVCKKQQDGRLFPLHFDHVTLKEAQQKIAWQLQGGFEGYEPIPLDVFRKSKLDLDILTPEAREQVK